MAFPLNLICHYSGSSCSLNSGTCCGCVDLAVCFLTTHDRTRLGLFKTLKLQEVCLIRYIAMDHFPLSPFFLSFLFSLFSPILFLFFLPLSLSHIPAFYYFNFWGGIMQSNYFHNGIFIHMCQYALFSFLPSPL